MEENNKTDFIAAEKKRSKQGILLTILILGVFTVYSLITGTAPLEIDVGDTEIVISAPGDVDYSITVPFEHITDIYASEDFQPGEMLSGGETEDCRYGTWKNDAFGEYSLCVNTDAEAYLIIKTRDGAAVANLDSAENTSDFAEALRELLKEDGYLKG